MIKAMIRFCLLWALLAPAVVQAGPWTVYDARAMGMGGAVVAASSRFAAAHNMAMAGRGEEFVDWYLALPTGGEEDLDFGDLSGGLDRFQQSLDVADLYALRERREHHHSFVGLVVSVPSDTFGAGGFLLKSEYLGARAVVGVPDTSDPFNIVYNSVIEKQVVRLVEHGLGFAQFRSQRWWLPKNTTFGLTPKLVLARTMVRRQPVESADLVYAFSEDETALHSAFNADISLMREYSRFVTLGLSIRNVLPMQFAFADAATDELVINPMLRVGFAYQRRDLSLAMDADLTSNEEIAFSGRSQYLSAGGEYVLAEVIGLRAGVRMNLAGEQEVVFSGGLGINWKGHNVDVAAWSGDQVEGLMAHLNLQF